MRKLYWEIALSHAYSGAIAVGSGRCSLVSITGVKGGRGCYGGIWRHVGSCGRRHGWWVVILIWWCRDGRDQGTTFHKAMPMNLKTLWVDFS